MTNENNGNLDVTSILKRDTGVCWWFGFGALATSTAAVFVYWKYKATRHDNIPMLETKGAVKWRHFFGHSRFLRYGVIQSEEPHHELQKSLRKDAPMTCVSLPSLKLVFVHCPEIARVLYSNPHFVDLQKSDCALDAACNRLFATEPLARERLQKHRFECALSAAKRTMKKVNKILSAKPRHKVLSVEWSNGFVDGDTVDMNELLGLFTLDSFIAAAFGKRSRQVESFPKLHRFPRSFDFIADRSVTQTTDFFWKFRPTRDLAEERLAAMHSDVIDEFIENMPNDDCDEDNAHDFVSLCRKEGCDESALRAAALKLVAAGRNATRSVASWCLFELSKRPSVLGKVRAEIDAIARDFEDLDFEAATGRMQLTECVLWETLRLRPSVALRWRICKSDVRLPEDFCARENDVFGIHNWSFGRDARIWQRPLQFQPSRWTLRSAPHAFVQCHAQSALQRDFGLLEAKAFLFLFLKEFEFECALPKATQPKQHWATMHLMGALPMKLKRRTKASKRVSSLEPIQELFPCD